MYGMIVRLSRTLPTEDLPGAGLHAYYYSKFISARTIIFCPNLKSKISCDFDSNVEVVFKFSPDLLLGNTSIRLMKFLILTVKFLGDVLFFFQVATDIRKRKLDVELIHVHSIGYVFTGLLLKYIYKCPIIFGFHGTDLLRVQKSRIIKFILSFYNGFICVSPLMPSIITNLFPDKKVSYIGNFVDTDFFTPRENKLFSDSDFILCVASLRWQKDIETLVKSYKIAFDECNDIPKLKIVGNGPLKELIKSLIINLKLNDQIFMVDSLSRDEIKTEMQNCKFFILTSVSEGFPKVVLEALACGKFVITTKVGALESIINSSVGYTVNMKNEVEIANAILKYSFEDLTVYERKCLEYSRLFSVKKVVSRVSSFYSEFNFRNLEK
jgi:glycosyltransferase involved in cell wall biosynthesis